MTYFPHSQEEIDAMLSAIGKKSLDDLTNVIPDGLKTDNFDLPDGKTEIEIMQEAQQLSSLNRPYSSIFLGAGAYNHYIPAAVDEIASRQEFYTAYTPYQAEFSQGTLQAIFEYQSYITALTGMDVSNASLYDGATALVEAVLMSLNTTRKKKVLIDNGIHPEYKEVLKTYMTPLDVEIVEYKGSPFSFSIDNFKSVWNNEFACFAIASPNFYGSILDLQGLADTIHDSRGLLISSITEILSLSIFNPPSSYDADIVCGEAQSLGIPLSYGGPYLGFISCIKKHMRKIPGRLVGKTVDKDDQTAYTLTLTAREQHIRRELATSNICSNHGLCALRASIFCSLLGKDGLTRCGLRNIEQSQKLKEKIKSLPGFSVNDSQLSFNEFVVFSTHPVEKIALALENAHILSFYPLSSFHDELANGYLITVTEQNTDTQIEQFIDVLRSIA